MQIYNHITFFVGYGYFLCTFCLLNAETSDSDNDSYHDGRTVISTSSDMFELN